MRVVIVGVGALLLLVLAPAATSGPALAAAQITVDAKANIFGAGQAAPPAPAGGGAGLAPPGYTFTAAADQVLVFTSVTGKVTCCAKSAPIPYNGPAGGKEWDNTAIPPVGGISGVTADKTMFLVGVFLGPGTPGRTPPATNTFTKSPKLRQVFYVGDGRGGRITVPARATRLFLGFADGFAFKGPAGAYDDNAGTITARFTIGPDAPPPTATPTPTVRTDALVPIESVSNGCGGGVASMEPRFGDRSTYLNSNDPAGQTFVVDFRDACNLHDAGYSGAKVRDKLNGRTIDFFTWTRQEVDEKFLDDMRNLCEKAIPAWAKTALADCKANGGKTSFGAESRYDVVRRFGGLFYNDRPNLSGKWFSPDNPSSSPKWTVTQRRREVTADWSGGKGHQGLRCHFEGLLVTFDQSSVVAGIVTSIEGSKKSRAPMRWTIRIKDQLRSEGGTSGCAVPRMQRFP